MPAPRHPLGHRLGQKSGLVPCHGQELYQVLRLAGVVGFEPQLGVISTTVAGCWRWGNVWGGLLDVLRVGAGTAQKSRQTAHSGRSQIVLNMSALRISYFFPPLPLLGGFDGAASPVLG
jgi:hypothetical protein